jgi:hypothetical protein
MALQVALNQTKSKARFIISAAHLAFIDLERACNNRKFGKLYAWPVYPKA